MDDQRRELRRGPDRLDLRGLTATTWANDESLSLMRGVASVRVPAPLWFMQTADQDVEDWALTGDRPIFTQHVPLQFDWMLITSLKRGSRMPTILTTAG